MTILSSLKRNYLNLFKPKFISLSLLSFMIVTVTFYKGDHSFSNHVTSGFNLSTTPLINIEDMKFITGFNKIVTVFSLFNTSLAEPKNVSKDNFELLSKSDTDTKELKLDNENTQDQLQSSTLFEVPKGFETRVQFWVNIYSKYTSNDAVFHDSQNLSLIYKVVDLRPLTESKLHPYVIEHKVKKLIKEERKKIVFELETIRKKLKRKKGSQALTVNSNNLTTSSLFNDREQELLSQLGNPTKPSQITSSINQMRMQLGQKDFVEKALKSSDLYLPHMEEIFEQKGLPKELTRIPFVESSFNLDARSKVGASGIWQIMPATGRKLILNELIDYRNDPLKATEFAATLLKFNLKVLDKWPLAITAYNHGPTSIRRITLKYKTDELTEIINKAYGSHAFGFASSNFYACFLAILDVEKNRSLYFPETSKAPPLSFATIQLKKGIKYHQLLSWFDKDKTMADQFNPHIAPSIKRGLSRIPPGTFLYLPTNVPETTERELPKLARRI